MIKIEKTEVVGFEHAIRGMRNPLNSWDKSDSEYGCTADMKEEFCPDICIENVKMRKYIIGSNDLNLMKKLRNAGTDHRKYLRMITVYMDITAPLYWWKEFDTYKVGTVANSCSTMHKIASKEFTLDDFSCEHLLNDCNDITIEELGDCYYKDTPLEVFKYLINLLNICRNKYIETKDKKYWWQMIQLLPSSYNQKRTVMMNYEVLANAYKSRNCHKLDEWEHFCECIKTLPYSELITGDVE